MQALEEVFAETMPREMEGSDYMGMAYQEKVAAEGVPPGSGLRALVVVRVSDSGGAIRKLGAAGQCAAGDADCRVRRICLALGGRPGA